MRSEVPSKVVGDAPVLVSDVVDRAGARECVSARGYRRRPAATNRPLGQPGQLIDVSADSESDLTSTKRSQMPAVVRCPKMVQKRRGQDSVPIKNGAMACILTLAGDQSRAEGARTLCVVNFLAVACGIAAVAIYTIDLHEALIVL